MQSKYVFLFVGIIIGLVFNNLILRFITSKKYAHIEHKQDFMYRRGKFIYTNMEVHYPTIWLGATDENIKHLFGRIWVVQEKKDTTNV